MNPRLGCAASVACGTLAVGKPPVLTLAEKLLRARARCERGKFMRWSWRIGKLAGIGIYVHATFLLLILFILFMNLRAGKSLATAMAGVVFILAIFACIVLHELGHALAARHYGIRTRDITLLPIGGLARLERMPDVPIQELWVALAGPAVNAVIAGGLFAIDLLIGVRPELHDFRWTGGGFLNKLMVVNIWLLVFNLIPAFPMDGGRMLRALLATLDGVSEGHSDCCGARSGPRIHVRRRRSVHESLPDVHRLIRMDWSGAGGERCADEIGIRRHAYPHCNDHRFPGAQAFRHLSRRRQPDFAGIPAGLPSRGTVSRNR